MKKVSVQNYSMQSELELKSGEILVSPNIAYETWGNLNADLSNAILITTGLSPSSHAASNEHNSQKGWWEKLIGPNKAIDTNQFFVICANSLGSCFGSTGPSSINPKTNQPYKLLFPKLSIEDIASSLIRLTNHLGIKQLHTIVGPSMGGMTALSIVKQSPEIAKQMILISTSTSSRPFSIALRSLQRKMITSDPAWKNGDYDLADLPLEGMRLARFLGMVTYRSPEEWNQRFGRELIENIATNASLLDNTFQVEDYLHNRSDDFIKNFDPNSYLYLSRAIDLFDVVDESNSLPEEFKQTTLKKIKIIGVNSDYIFPFECQKELNEKFLLSGIESELIKLQSIQGHDSFLVDDLNFGKAIFKFLQ